MLLYDKKFMKHLGKLHMHWLGTYIINSITSGGAIVVKNIAPFVDRSYSSGLNGSDPEQISERQRVKTFPKCCKHLE